jgi:hypothetical protein
MELFILQCRPQSHLHEEVVKLPKEIEKEKVIFATSRIVPHGKVEDIHYVLFISPESYYALPTSEARRELITTIGKLNKVLEGETFICVGPGRWGTVNPDLGIGVSYADIYNTRALIELSGTRVGPAPEPSYGTHFFQDLIESRIFPLAIYLEDADAEFNKKFFYETPNKIAIWLPEHSRAGGALRLIRVEDFAPSMRMELIMDSGAGRAVAYLKPEGA